MAPIDMIINQSQKALRRVANSTGPWTRSLATSNIRFVTQTSTSSSTNQDERPDMPVSDMKNPYQKEPRCCVLCRYNIEFDYKNPRLLSQFISSFTGQIYDNDGQHITGLCDKQQKLLRDELHKAYMCGYISNYYKFPQYFKDPKLFDPTRPMRPHPY